MECRKVSLSEICGVLNYKFYGKDITIDGLNLCNRKSKYKRILSYIAEPSYINAALGNQAIAALIVSKLLLDQIKDKMDCTCIVCDMAENAFYDVHDYLYRNGFYQSFEFDSEIGEAQIHSSAVIEQGVKIGNGVKIGANSVIRRGTVIKDHTSIGCNCTIGSEGFQVIKVNGKNRKVPHAGGVYISEGVSIGDNCTVANSLFEDTTYLGKGVMIDDLCYIGHNSVIEDDAVITAGTTICGSSHVRGGAWIGAGSVQLNKTIVGENAKIGIGSVITRSIPDQSLAYGVPAKVKQ